MIRIPLLPICTGLLSTSTITCPQPQTSPDLAERTRPQTLKAHSLVYCFFAQLFQKADAKIASLIQQVVLHTHYVHGAV